MKYLFRYLNGIKTPPSDKPLFIFLDYDGTVTPIRQKPALGRISKRAKNILSQLSKTPGCTLAVISGRSLKDVSKMVGLKNVIYAGNHGLELNGPQICFKSPVTRRHKTILNKIYNALNVKLGNIKGVLIENKGLSLSVHYRLVAPKNVRLVKAIFCQITADALSRKEIHVRPGKMVLEAFPPVNWDKGRAVQWLLKKRGHSTFPIYIGDDVSDEVAFKLLKDSGLTVFVGTPHKTSARYFVKNTNEVLNFLRRVLKLKLASSKNY